MTKRLQVYETPAITVSFDPNVCRHTGVCLRTLPAVFDVRRARWIRPDEANPDEVASAVQKCPSGALQFYRNVARDPVAAALLARRMLLNHLALICDGDGTVVERTKAASEAIARARGYDYVGLYDVSADEVVVVGWSGNEPPTHPKFPAGNGLCGAVARSGVTRVVNDVTADPAYITTTGATRSEMVVPVVDPSTHDVVGTLVVASHQPNHFSDEDRSLMEDCAGALPALWTERE